MGTERLAEVTLCAADARTPGLAWASLQRSMAALPFGRAVLFTHAWQPETPVAGLEVVDVGPIDSAAAYSQFVMRGLQAHITTPFVLVTQWDGFVIDAGAWRDEFLQYDYIGAPWAAQPASLSVGNGPFSLRSQAFLRMVGLAFLLHAPHTRPQFLAYSVKDLPAAAPLIARHIFGLPLLTWTVRDAADRENARRWADQMIFEGFRP